MTKAQAYYEPPWEEEGDFIIWFTYADWVGGSSILTIITLMLAVGCVCCVPIYQRKHPLLVRKARALYVLSEKAKVRLDDTVRVYIGRTGSEVKLAATVTPSPPPSPPSQPVNKHGLPGTVGERIFRMRQLQARERQRASLRSLQEALRDEEERQAAATTVDEPSHRRPLEFPTRGKQDGKQGKILEAAASAVQKHFRSRMNYAAATQMIEESANKASLVQAHMRGHLQRCRNKREGISLTLKSTRDMGLHELLHYIAKELFNAPPEKRGQERKTSNLSKSKSETDALPAHKMEQLLGALAIGDGTQTPFAWSWLKLDGWAGLLPNWLGVLLELIVVGLWDALMKLICFYIDMLSVTFDLALVMTSISYLGQVTASLTRVSWFSFTIEEPLQLMFGSFKAILPFRLHFLDWILLDLFIPFLQLISMIGIELPQILLEIPVMEQCKGIYSIFALLFYVGTLFLITLLVDVDWMLRLKLFPWSRNFFETPFVQGDPLGQARREVLKNMREAAEAAAQAAADAANAASKLVQEEGDKKATKKERKQSRSLLSFWSCLGGEEKILGQKWRCMGTEAPEDGKELKNELLRKELYRTQNFTKEEWLKFNIPDLCTDHYIQSGYMEEGNSKKPKPTFYKPVEEDNLERTRLDNVAARLKEPPSLSKAMVQRMTRLLKKPLRWVCRLASDDPGEAERLSDSLEQATSRQADEIKSVQDVLKAVADPVPFLCSTAGPVLLRMAGPAVRRIVISKLLRPFIEPQLKLMDLRWDDVSPALELIDTIEELNEAKDHPREFLNHLIEKAIGPAAVRFALAVAKPKIEPLLNELSEGLSKEKGLKWNDVRPALELIDSAEKVRNIVEKMRNIHSVEEVGVLIDQLGGPAAIRKWTIARLRQPVETFLNEERFRKKKEHLDGEQAVEQRAGLSDAFLRLEWQDLEPILLQIDDLQVLQKALTDPRALLVKLEQPVSGDASDHQLRKGAVLLAMTMARPHVERYLKKHRKPGLSWTEIKPALQLIEDPDALKTAVKEPGSLLQRLRQASDKRIGKDALMRFAIAEARQSIIKYLNDKHIKTLCVSCGELNPSATSCCTCSLRLHT